MKKRGKIILGVVGGLILAILLVLVLYPAIIISKFSDDLVKVSHVDINIADGEIDMKVDLAIRNEAPFYKLLDSISYTVSFDTFQFVSGAKNTDKVRQGEEFDSLMLPVLLDLETMQTAIKKLQDKDSTSLEIHFVAHYDWPIVGKVNVPVNVVHRMPPPNPPEVELADISIEKFSFNDPVIDLKLKVINENSFSLILKDVHVYLKMEDLFEGEVHHPETLHIKAKDESMVDLTVQIHELKALKSAWQFLISKPDVNFNMHLTGKYLAEKGDPDPINLDVATTGSIDLGK
ncbi:hypothetical protein BH09BAC1_BH09BAC1_15320 [soil metagenome]